MTSSMTDDTHRLEQAAEWLLQVQAEHASPEVFAQMLAWCDADPANRQALERIEDAWAMTGELTSVPWPTAAEIAEVTPQPAAAAESWVARSANWLKEKVQFRAPRLVVGALAASVLVAGVLALMTGHLRWTLNGGGPVERLATARGAYEESDLPDGSKVELGGRSSVAVLFSDKNRVVVVEDGEAFYKVAKDPGRPFIVRAGPVTVTAVGTAFSVRRTGDSVSVIVTEGVVDIQTSPDGAAGASVSPVKRNVSVRAEAGQRVRFDRGELSQSIVNIKPELATSWREGRLDFVDEPLRLVVASVNRYANRELLISDPAIEELRFTGTVFEKGVDSWLTGVAAVFPVRIVEIDKRRIMIAPASVESAVAQAGAR